MCQYSAVDGCTTDWHTIHLGQLALSGAALVTIEATAVVPEGRISYADVGLWDDKTEAAMRATLASVRCWSAIPIAIQLAHAGRKACTEVPWKGGEQLPPGDPCGWQAQAPSPLSFAPEENTPDQLSKQRMNELKDAFAAAARRADGLADQLTAEHGGRFVSAPVFGRPAAAEAGKLFVVAAGNDSALQFSSAIFAAVAQQAFWIGTHPPDANLIKLSGNFTIMAAVDAMAEAMTLVEKGSVTPSKLLEVLTGTLFGAPVYHSYGEILLEQRFRPAGFAAPLGLKDMGLADAAATALRVTMPLLGIVRDHLRAAIGQNGEDIDWAAAGLVGRRGAGIEETGK